MHNPYAAINTVRQKSFVNSFKHVEEVEKQAGA